MRIVESIIAQVFLCAVILFALVVLANWMGVSISYE
jgi:hypothetical protein